MGFYRRDIIGARQSQGSRLAECDLAACRISKRATKTAAALKKGLSNGQFGISSTLICHTCRLLPVGHSLIMTFKLLESTFHA